MNISHADIAAIGSCKKCGFPVLRTAINNNHPMSYQGWIYWQYCTNRACANHTGEGENTERGCCPTWSVFPSNNLSRDLFEKECFVIENYQVQWSDEFDQYVSNDIGYRQEPLAVNQMYIGWQASGKYKESLINAVKWANSMHLAYIKEQADQINSLRAELDLIHKLHKQLVLAHPDSYWSKMHALFIELQPEPTTDNKDDRGGIGYEREVLGQNNEGDIIGE